MYGQVTKGGIIFLFKQKTAYEITVCLEFRRVLFRSEIALERVTWVKEYDP